MFPKQTRMIALMSMSNWEQANQPTVRSNVQTKNVKDEKKNNNQQAETNLCKCNFHKQQLFMES